MSLEKILVLLIIIVAFVSVLYVLAYKKTEEKEILTPQLLLNVSKVTIVDVLQDKKIQITTVRPLNRTTSSYYNSSFLWERKFVNFRNFTLIDIEVYYFDNSTERSRVISKFIEDDKGETFVNIESTTVDGWFVRFFDFRSLIDGKIVGWGGFVEKDEKAIYFILTSGGGKEEREEVVRWIIKRF